jgi:hypothetical protein
MKRFINRGKAKNLFTTDLQTSRICPLQSKTVLLCVLRALRHAAIYFFVWFHGYTYNVLAVGYVPQKGATTLKDRLHRKVAE